MIGVASPNDWSRGPDGGVFLKVAVPGPVGRIVVTARGWRGDEQSDARVQWFAHGAEPGEDAGFYYVGARAEAVMTVKRADRGELTVSARTAPVKAVWRTHAPLRGSAVWDRIVPIAATPERASTGGGELQIARIAGQIEAGDIDDAIADIAWALMDPRDERDLAAVKYLLQELSRRPFARSRNLGALACALTSL